MKWKSVPGDIFLDDLTSTHAAQQDVWYAGSLNTPSAEYDLVEEKKLRSQFQYTQKPFNRDELYER